MERRDLALVLVLGAIWGVSFMFISMGLRHATPFWLEDEPERDPRHCQQVGGRARSGVHVFVGAVSAHTYAAQPCRFDHLVRPHERSGYAF